jgi:FlaA1/EpsC-like NDP-sugar epimerase
MGSRGSVIPFFLEKAKTGVLPITDPTMTRFNISLSEGVAMVLWALEHALGSRADSKYQCVLGPGWRIAIASSAVMSCITACIPPRID